MDRLRLSFACWDYDRVLPLTNKVVSTAGLELAYIPLAPEETFFRAFRHQEFDICELSFATLAMMIARGNAHYTPIPVFPSRAFRHSSIYVSAASGIESASDLRGRRIGVPEYQMTAAVVARGLLSDEYGVNSNDVQWVQSGLNSPDREDKVSWTPPTGLTLTKDRDYSLNELLTSGSIDALISPRTPTGFGIDKSAKVRRLFPDSQKIELEYYSRTGVFPIMHVIGIRNALLDTHPWIANSLVASLTNAKNIALSQLRESVAYKVSLPLLSNYVTESADAFGDDFWPYGVKKNRVTLNAQFRWLNEQGITSDTLSIEKFFPKQTLESFSI